jgi:hypothetical protein
VWDWLVERKIYYMLMRKRLMVEDDVRNEKVRIGYFLSYLRHSEKLTY